MDLQVDARTRELQAEAVSLLRPLNPALAARLERDGVSPEQADELSRMVTRYKTQSLQAVEAQRLFQDQSKEYEMEGRSDPHEREAIDHGDAWGYGSTLGADLS